jgi:hypothetical protein
MNHQQILHESTPRRAAAFMARSVQRRAILPRFDSEVEKSLWLLRRRYARAPRGLSK